MQNQIFRFPVWKSEEEPLLSFSPPDGFVQGNGTHETRSTTNNLSMLMVEQKRSSGGAVNGRAFPDHGRAGGEDFAEVDDQPRKGRHF